MFDFDHLPNEKPRPVFSRGAVEIYRATGRQHHIAQVIREMRDRDVHEYTAVGATTAELIETVQCAKEAFIAYVGGVPVFVFGYVTGYPHVAMIFGSGTAKTEKAVPAITEFGKRTLAPGMFASGVTRMEVRVPKSCETSIAWLMKAFGARVEATLEGFSITGEPYKQLALTKRMFDNVQSKAT